MPRKLRRSKRGPPRARPRWRPTEEQRRELSALLEAVDPTAGEDDARFLALLTYWQGCEPPSDAFPLAHAYLCKGGTWLVDSVATAISAIRVHVEADREDGKDHAHDQEEEEPISGRDRLRGPDLRWVLLHVSG